MIPAFPVYLFDLDGTIMDSAEDICGAVEAVLAARGRTGVSRDLLRTYIGRHLYDEFLELGFPHEEIEPMITEYRAIYPARGHANTRVYPGVRETIARLGGRKSTATTKGTPTTRAVLEQFGLLSHFDHVQGTDGFPAKPSPDVLFKCMEVFRARPEDCLFIGDSPSDMEAGRRAGVRICAVSWGYGDPLDLAKFEPDYWVNSPAELVSEA